ncbi:iron complex outermembrane receptor protein [Novosphingobium sp. SG707]|nr:iron complex outermembrane receptor protein [Novosphingobium sp. SG707]
MVKFREMCGAAAVAMVVMGLGAAPMQAQAQTPQMTQNIDIPAGPLGNAIAQLGRKVGVMIAFDPALLRGQSTAGLRGAYTPAQALERLLQGSGAEARPDGHGGFTLVRRAARATRKPASVHPAPRTPEKMEPAQSDDIVVTAIGTKTNTPLRETPQSISVVSMEQARERSILSVGDAVTYSAGVFANTKGVTYGGDALAIRGFGNDGTTGTATNSYIDGLRLSGTGYASGALDPYLYEQVEVVKGPTSVLFGQSTPGGLINMVSKRPQSKAGGEILLRYGTFDRKQVAGDITGPLTQDDRLLYRLSGTYFDTNGMTAFSNRKRVMVAPSLTWKPGERTTLTLLTHYQKDNFKGSTLNWLPTIGTIIANPYGNIAANLFTGDPNYQGWRREVASAGYQLEHRFSDAITFNQNFRYTNNRLNNQNIYIAALAADLRTATRQAFGLNEKSDDFTIDNRATLKFDTGAVAHQVLVGLDAQSFQYSTVREFVTAPTLDLFAPVYYQTIPARAPFRNQKYNNRQIGLYAQDQIAYEGWRLLVGLRQDWTRYRLTSYLPTGATDNSNAALTKRAALLHNFDNGLAPYFSYAESFTPQYGSDYSGKSFDPEMGRQYEIGIKFQPRGSQSFVTAAIFDLRRKNYLTADRDHSLYFVQIGEVRMRGLELEGHVKLPAGFNAIGAYTLLDSRVTNSNDTVSGIDPADLTVKTRAQQGLRLMAVPMHNASLWLKYANPMGVTLAGGLRYTSETFGDAANYSRVPAFTLVDASLRFDLGAWRPGLKGLELSAKASNLFDKRYIASCVGTNRCYYGEGRHVIVDLAWRW